MDWYRAVADSEGLPIKINYIIKHKADEKMQKVT